MRNTMSTRTFASDGSSPDASVALLAMTDVESPGMSNRSASPVAWALLRPVLISAVVVSNAGVPGRPAVSFAGNVSLMNCQMSADTAPIDAVVALAWPGTPGLSTNANAMLSKYIPSLELHPSAMANRKHCCVQPIRMCSESGIPPGFEVTNGNPSSRKPSKSVKHCGSGLKRMKPGYCRSAQQVLPFDCTAG